MTVKQKQCLLAYLGYYEGEIDGKYGPVTRMATEAFQSDYQLSVDGVFGTATQARIREVIAAGEWDDWWGDIRYFTRQEFACKCGCYCDGYPARMQRTVVELADRARVHFNAPAVIVSGLRCQTHNANVGGVANSRHMYGEAVDFYVQGIGAQTLLEFILAQPEVRYAYAINDTNVHVDIPKSVR